MDQKETNWCRASEELHVKHPRTKIEDYEEVLEIIYSITSKSEKATISKVAELSTLKRSIVARRTTDLEKEGLIKAKKETKNLIKQLKEQKKEVHEEQETQLIQGVKGIKTIINNIIEEGKDYISFGGPIESEEFIDETWWLNFQIK